MGAGVELIQTEEIGVIGEVPAQGQASRPTTKEVKEQSGDEVPASNGTVMQEFEEGVVPPTPSSDLDASANQDLPPKDGPLVLHNSSVDERPGNHDTDPSTSDGVTGDSVRGEEHPLVEEATDSLERSVKQGSEGELESKISENIDSTGKPSDLEGSAVFPPPPGSPMLLAARDQSHDYDKKVMQDDVSELQYTHDLEMEREYMQKNEYFDDMTAVEEELVLPDERIRHIILPLNTTPGPLKEGEEGGSWERCEEKVVFSSGTQHLYGYIEYEYDTNPDFDGLNIFVQPRREHLYGKSVNLREPGSNGEFEKAVYLCDIFVRPGEGAYLLSEAEDMHSLQGSQAFIPSPSSLYQEYTRKREFHCILLRSYVAEVDLVEVVTGPVIGEISQNSARIALELSQPMRQLSVICRPLGKCAGDGVPVNKINEAIRTATEVPDHYYLDCEPLEERAS